MQVHILHVLHACLAVLRQAKVDAASLDRLFMQAYDFKHMSLDLYIVRTNLNPRTIMRSPGFINSVMVTIFPSTLEQSVLSVHATHIQQIQHEHGGTP